MSAHEFMNMARVRAEQAEARAEMAEHERDSLRSFSARREEEVDRLREQVERLKGEREEAHAQRDVLEERIARMRPVIQAARDEVYEGERDDPAGFDVAAFYEMKERAEKAEAALADVRATLRIAAHEGPHGACGSATRFLLWEDLARHGYGEAP